MQVRDTLCKMDISSVLDVSIRMSHSADGVNAEGMREYHVLESDHSRSISIINTNTQQQA